MFVSQVKLQKHQAFEAEISAHTNTIIMIRTSGEQMITEEHYESITIRVRNYTLLQCNLFKITIYLK